MKKIKVAMISLAIIVAVGGAFASRPKQDCNSFPQYYRLGNYFFEAGQFGTEYICLTNIGVCTYYRPAPVTNPNFYLPCKQGFYWPAF